MPSLLPLEELPGRGLLVEVVGGRHDGELLVVVSERRGAGCRRASEVIGECEISDEIRETLALVERHMQQLLQELDAPLGSFQLPHPIDGLPNDTPSVILLPLDFWNRHAGDVIDIDAPELHPGAVLIIEDVARAVGLSPESLMEYVRRGTFPQPPVRLGRTPAWPRPVVEQWIAQRRPVRVVCEGCGQETEMHGLMAKTSEGDLYTVPLCPACGERITKLLPRNPHPWSVELIRRLLRMDTK